MAIAGDRAHRWAEGEGLERRHTTLGAAARRVCARVAAPGDGARRPEALAVFADIARHRPMTDTAGRLARIAAPTLVIHGDVDPLGPLDNGLAPAGHIPGVERADVFHRDVLAFLEGRSGQ